MQELLAQGFCQPQADDFAIDDFCDGRVARLVVELEYYGRMRDLHPDEDQTESRYRYDAYGYPIDDDTEVLHQMMGHWHFAEMPNHGWKPHHNLGAI